MKTSEVKFNSNGGVGFVGLLTILFIALKLMGYITWSWWWVLSPIWISLLVALTVFVIALVVLAVTDK
jgi:hypothetical protein